MGIVYINTFLVCSIAAIVMYQKITGAKAFHMLNTSEGKKKKAIIKI